MNLREIIEKLSGGQILSHGEFVCLLKRRFECADELASMAQSVAVARFGHDVYMRGLIEFTNYCVNNCLYCGIRAGNAECERYRLSAAEIYDCCAKGYEVGFRTFVLQGGEDRFYNYTLMCEIIHGIKSRFPDCALTLSFGEKDFDTYKGYFDAGADRYLLREETADLSHYSRLHPANMSLENRMRCLRDLKKIGFQTGAGFMVGSPFQTLHNIASDLIFIQDLRPEMVGVGPFIPHKNTEFCDFINEDGLELTLFILSVIRLMLSDCLLPATTAVGTLDVKGREKAILRGANVVMPNLSPISTRKKYMLYDGKICTGDEAAECVRCLGRRLADVGYRLVTARGDYKGEKR